jgi:hypothetical protein
MSDEMRKAADYFRENIFEAKSAYTTWKKLAYSRAKKVVGRQLAEKYTEIQNYHGSYFTITQKSLLITWVVLICHCFEKRSDSFSIEKIAKKKYISFFNDNKGLIEQLLSARSKLFAHRNKNITPTSIKIPSIDKMDQFWIKIEGLYNSITLDFGMSETRFDGAESIKTDIENLYANLYRGEAARLAEIDVKYTKSLETIASKVI